MKTFIIQFHDNVTEESKQSIINQVVSSGGVLKDTFTIIPAIVVGECFDVCVNLRNA